MTSLQPTAEGEHLLPRANTDEPRVSRAVSPSSLTGCDSNLSRSTSRNINVLGYLSSGPAELPRGESERSIYWRAVNDATTLARNGAMAVLGKRVARPAH
ncbi:hypothetical protein Bbelb_280310 [Branchiostoma belcheri]|nr:hypothetical protein Bbelb_280310 [Branchiostoma belcheri]